MKHYFVKRLIQLVLFVTLTYAACFVALQFSPITQKSTFSVNTGSQRMDWEEMDHSSLSLPPFYFSISNSAMPRFQKEADALSVKSSQILALYWGNKHLVSEWNDFLQSKSNVWVENQALRNSYFEGLKCNDPVALMHCFCDQKNEETFLIGLCEKLRHHQQAASWDRFIPEIKWNGTLCRFHEWLFNSLTSKRPDVDMVLWSMSLGMSIFLFCLLIGTILGLLLVWLPFPFFFRLLSTFSYSLPSFAIVVIALALFLIIAPGYALPVTPAPEFLKLLIHSPFQILEKLWLPAFASGLAPGCYLAAVWEQSIRKEMGQDYVRTLKAKGMSKGLGMAKHVLRNALFAPMGVMVVYLPALLSGSLVMENLFSIPGMGRELMILWQQRDFAALLSLFSFQASIAVVVWSFMDILLVWADPRISQEA